MDSDHTPILLYKSFIYTSCSVDKHNQIKYMIKQHYLTTKPLH